MAAHGFYAESDVVVQIHIQLFGALDNVLAIDGAGESFVFHLFAYAGGLDLGDGFLWLYQGTRGEKSGQFVAREKSLGQMAVAGDAGILGVAKDSAAHFGRPSQSLQFADAYEGMFLGRGMALVVKIVQQGGGGVELEQRFTLGSTQT